MAITKVNGLGDNSLSSKEGVSPPLMISYLEKDPHPKFVTPTFLIGVEHEIENVVHYNETKLQKLLIGCTKDGSLRNHGLEFITSPCTKEETFSNFVKMLDCLELGEDAFSSRTSIHVHMNVIGMEINHFLTLLYAYAAIEPFFFNFVGKERQSNIHCLPLSDTYLSKYYKEQDPGLFISKWSKYTALNLKPIHNQGSIEFRHMYGTGDPSLFYRWVNYIEALYKYAQRTSLLEFYNFWLTGGTGKRLEALIFNEDSTLTEQDYFVSVMEAKTAFL